MADIATSDNGEIAEDVPQDEHSTHKTSLGVLMLGALGVVFGDIGTSPIYAFREALHAAAGDQIVVRSEVLGILSLIVWALTLIVTVKYVAFVLRADNQGEGGTLSLMALARRARPEASVPILIIGMIGASLFFGDSIITPAISVLSAVEGLKQVTPQLDPYIVPITLVILIGLFSVQRFGTAKVASVFGPVTALWFLTLGVSGARHIFDDPAVFTALNPWHAISFLIAEKGVAFVTIGAVFLAVTGAEALYVDLGHFGRRPIVMTWLAIVFPCLLLNYFGQGAFVLVHLKAAENPFFEMQADWALLPVVILATMATIIASQAVISGAFSLTRQAAQLNILPRIRVLHTSATQHGQIYMPTVNMLIAVAVIVLVLAFGASTNLASAYGISVTGEMLVTSVLLFVVMRGIWKWALALALGLCVLFGAIDATFLAANATKFFEGGWVSIGVAIMMLGIMITWWQGSRYLFDYTRRSEIPLADLLKRFEEKMPPTVPGTAVYLTADPESAPTAMLHSLKHYKALHDKNVILSVVTASKPRVPESERVSMEELSPYFRVVKLNFGYMEEPNVPQALALCRKMGWKFDIMDTSFFFSRRSFKASARLGLPVWQDRLFIWLARNATDATHYFQIPTGRVVELGTQVKI